MNRWRTKNESADDNNTKQSRHSFSMSRSSSRPGASAVYPQILEDQELLDDNPSSISDSKSGRPYEEDATSTSFHTAKSHETLSLLHGQRSHADSSSSNFLSCHEGSDRSGQCWVQLPADVESTSGGFPEHFSDLDETSFHTCPRFNDQGLRSALSIPTTQNNGQFNIPLQVFAASIEKAAEERQAKRQRERLLRLQLKILSGIVIVCSAIATIIWLSTRERTENSHRIEQRPSPSLAPSWINAPSVAPTVRSNAPFPLLPSSNNSPTSSLPQLFGSLTRVTDSPTNLMPSELVPSLESLPASDSAPPITSAPSSALLALDQTRPPSEAIGPPPASSSMSIAPTPSPTLKSKSSPKQQESAKDTELPSIIGLLGASSSVAPSVQPSMAPPLASAPPSYFWFETSSFVLVESKAHEEGL